MIGRNGPLEFDIPGNSAAYIDLNRSRLRVGPHVLTGEGKPVTEAYKVCLPNLGLQSLFRQVDIELNQRLITASMGSYYLYKAYIGFHRRYKWTSKGNTVFLKDPIRMDICQHKKLIVNGIRMKVY